MGITITINSDFFIGMPWKLNELMHIKHLDNAWYTVRASYMLN